MLRRFKQRLDRWAIQVGAATLPSPMPRPDQAPEIETIIRNNSFLVPSHSSVPAVILEEGPQHRLSFRFPSQVETPFPENNVARGWLVPSGRNWKGKPLVLLVHGWNAELHYRHVLPRVARKLANKGMNAAAIELPFHSHRRPAPPAVVRNFISDDIPMMLQATRQAIADLNLFLRWAREQGCPSVALWGFSLGGWLAGLHACVSDAQDAAVLTTPVPDMDEAIRTLLFCAPIRAALRTVSVDLTWLNLTSRTPVIPASRVLLHQADYDAFVSPEGYQALADAWGGIARKRDLQSHISILVSRKSNRSCIDWLARELGAAY